MVVKRAGVARLCALALLIAAVLGFHAWASGGDEAAKIQQIRSKINALLGAKPLQNARVGIDVVDLSSGKRVYSHNRTIRLLPASNMKIITAAAALEILKPEYRFKTEVYIDAPIRNGRVDGNIFIKGYGDPLLVDENLWTIARDVAYRGISSITGKVLCDDFYFDDERYGRGWGRLTSDAYNAPIGALSLNFNTFVVTVVPGPEPGTHPKVFLMPPDRHLELVNRATTVSSGRAKIKVVGIPGKVNAYDVIGQASIGNGAEKVRRTVGDPGLYAAGSFEAYLTSWGVMTSGKIDRKPVHDKARLLVSYASPPLSRAIWSMGKVSNNFVSEQILKTMGAEGSPDGKPRRGDAEKGIKAVEKYLKGLGIEPGEYVMVDGSGLSRMDRLTAAQVDTVLVRMRRTPAYEPEFIASLGVGGVDGTVEDRFTKGPLKRRIRAKTGHLNGVNCLSGYLQTDSGRMLAFSILMNNFSGYHSTVERLQEKILTALAEY